MKAARVLGPGKIVIEDVPVPEPNEKEILIAVQRVGICGTDVDILGGHVPVKYPLTLGHEFAGTIAGLGGSSRSAFKEGDAVMSGSQVNVKWGWGGNTAYLDMCELQVDRGDGKGFGPLAFDTTPNYTDTQPFPAARAVWTYRAIYRVGDGQVGLWSQPVSVAVPA